MQMAIVQSVTRDNHILGNAQFYAPTLGILMDRIADTIKLHESYGTIAHVELTINNACMRIERRLDRDYNRQA